MTPYLQYPSQWIPIHYAYQCIISNRRNIKTYSTYGPKYLLTSTMAETATIITTTYNKNNTEIKKQTTCMPTMCIIICLTTMIQIQHHDNINSHGYQIWQLFEQWQVRRQHLNTDPDRNKKRYWKQRQFKLITLEQPKREKEKYHLIGFRRKHKTYKCLMI